MGNSNSNNKDILQVKMFETVKFTVTHLCTSMYGWGGNRVFGKSED